MSPLQSSSKGWVGEEDGGFKEAISHSRKLGVGGGRESALLAKCLSLNRVLQVLLGVVRLVPGDQKEKRTSKLSPGIQLE